MRLENKGRTAEVERSSDLKCQTRLGSCVANRAHRFGCYLIASMALLSVSVASQAEVSATFTTAAIAEYSSSNANQNQSSLSISDGGGFSTGQGLKSVTISQVGTVWGGTQGNDTGVTLTVTFQDDTTAAANGSLNWVKNKQGGGISYFGIVFPDFVGPADNYLFVDNTLKKTYILPLPGEEAAFTPLIASDSTDGSANFGPNEIQDLIDALTISFPPDNPSKSVTKTVALTVDADNSGTITLGDTLTYSVTVRNTGNVALTDVRVSDPLLSLSNVLCSNNLSVPSGGSSECVVADTYVVTQADSDAGSISNTATATSTEATQVSDTIDTPVTQTPGIALIKTGAFNDGNGNNVADVGETITYSFTVTNTGNVTVTNIGLTDAKVTVAGGPIASLSPGAVDSSTFSASYTITQADIDAGKVTNTAVATGDSPTGTDDVTDDSGSANDNDTPTETPLPSSASIALIKTVSLNDGGDGLQAGDTLEYVFTVTNTGNVTLTDVTLEDDKVSVVGGPLTLLAVGSTDETTFTATYVITQADIDAGSVSNQALARAEAPGGNPADPSDDVTDISDNNDPAGNDPTIFNFVLSPTMVVAKEVELTADNDGSNSVTFGDELTYTITATNTGNQTLTNVVINDPTAEPSSVVCEPLSPMAACVLTASYVVTDTDVIAGQIENTATATAAEIVDPVSDTVITPVNVGLADLSMDKNITMALDADGGGTLTPGDEVRFSLVVTNTSVDGLPTNAATGVVIEDKLGPRYEYLSHEVTGTYDPDTGMWDPGPIPVDSSATLTIRARTTSEGPYENCTQVVSNATPDPDSSPGNFIGVIPQEDDEACAPPAPILGLSSEFGTAVKNQEGNYTIPVTFVLENTGIVDVCRVTLTDDLVSVFGAGNVVSVSKPVTTGRLVANPNFDGVSDINLLDSTCEAGSSFMPQLSDAVVKFNAVIKPAFNGSESVTYTHSAYTSALSKDPKNPTIIIEAEDQSTSGPEPDPNRDGAPDENTPNTLELKDSASVTVGVTANLPQPNDDGTFSTTLRYVVTNTGNVVLSDVSLASDLSVVFPAGYAIDMTGVEISSDLFTLNPSYDGESDAELFLGDSESGFESALSVGEEVIIEVPITFTPGDAQTFVLTAQVSGESVVGAATDDASDDVGPTAGTVSIAPSGVLGVSLRATPPMESVPSADPNARCENAACVTTLTLGIENEGNTDLNGVEIVPELGGDMGLPAGTVVTIRSISSSGEVEDLDTSLISQTFVVGEDPIPSLLNGGDELRPGEGGSIELVIEFTLPAGTAQEDFAITAEGGALDESGAAVTDASNNGTQTDTEGDGPGDNDDPTPLEVAAKPIIGVVAQNGISPDQPAVVLVDSGDATLAVSERELTYRTNFVAEITNLGNTTLNDIDVVNSLEATFPTLASDPSQPLSVDTSQIVIIKVTYDDQGNEIETPIPAAVNPNYDGINDTNLVDPSAVNLAPGESIRIQFSVEITVNYGDTDTLEALQRQTFDTSIAANGTDPNTGRTISDLSNNVEDASLITLSSADVRARIDTDGDFDPNEEGENEPTPIVFPSAAQGNLCRDSNGDQLCTDVDEPLAGWSVVITKADGTPALDASGEPLVIETDDDGYYAVPSLPKGAYVATFVTPQGVSVGSASGSAQSLSILQLSFLIDPRGVVYDSLTGDPIGGVRLYLSDKQGEILPAACLSPSEQQGQVTGSIASPSPLGLAPGEYQFLVNADADPKCPTSATEYRILIDRTTMPDGYSLSTLKAASSSAVDATSSPCTVAGVVADAIDTTARCEITQSPLPDISNGIADYYLDFILSGGSVDVVNNHIPLDPALDGSILVAKETPKRRVSVGDLVPYTVRAENLAPVGINNVILRDMPPAGFAVAVESARVRRAGPDGILDTIDDVLQSVSVAGARPVNLGPIEIGASESVRFEYIMRVGSGVRQGIHTNQATPTRFGEVVGNTGTADVEVVADPLFDLTTIIGKVFHDRNGNGMQDEGEEGLAGVRIASLKGEWLITDAFGRYSLPGVNAGQNAWGRNFVLKVDKASLPLGTEFTTENPRVLRITGGLMNQMDFGVKLPEAVPMIQKRSISERSTQTQAVDLGPIYFESGEHIVTDDYVTKLESALEAIQQGENIRVVVAGNTDSQPLSERAAALFQDNYGLASSRAQSVAKVLAANLGMSMDQFVTYAYGPDKPAASNDTAAGMAQNRRVDVSIVYDSVTTVLREVDGRQATVILKGDAFSDRGLAVAGLSALRGIARAMANDSFDLIRVEIPMDDDFVNRRAIIYAYLSGQLEGNMNSMSKLLVVESKAISHHPKPKLWQSALATVLNILIAPAMAQDAVCINELLCNNDSVSVLISEVSPAPSEAQGSQAATLGGAQVWLSSSPGMKTPHFAFRVPENIVWQSTAPPSPVELWVSNNLGDHIKSWTLEVYDNRELNRSTPVATVEGEKLIAGQAVVWDPSSLNESKRTALDSIALKFVLVDRAGTLYETVMQQVDVHHQGDVDLNDDIFRDDQTWYEDLADENHLIDNDHNLPGALVTLNASGLPSGGSVALGPHRYPVGPSGKLQVPLYHPPGDHTLGVTVFDENHAWIGTQDLPISVAGDYFFMVGLVEFTAGKQTVEGNIELLQNDYHHDGSVYVDGRVAYFLKGQILGKYLVTAQLDTEEQELSNLFDDLNRARPDKLFKRIDPDRYYPVYGDDSRVVRDVDTQGKFYVRIDWDRSSGLWGNYNTSLTGTELSNYNRSLYGMKVDYRSQEQTGLGDDKTTLKVFASEPSTRAARDELIGTGGSLYYLNHADVVLGSAKVMVEVRDRTSERVREQIVLIEGQDYEIDEFQGRIILTRPLRSTANLSVLSIIRNTPLDGNDVVLVVDYEYVPEIGFGADDLTAGIRAKQWFGDHLAIGVTSVNEQMAGSTYSLRGADITLKATKGTYITLETSETDARQAIDSAISFNGGLDYDSLSNPSLKEDGAALAVNARIDLSDFSDTNGHIGAWYRDQDPGFSSTQFSNRSGDDRTSQGVEAYWSLLETVDVKFRAEENDYGVRGKDDQLGLQLDWRVDDGNTIGLQYLSQADERTGFERDSDVVGLRLTRRFTDDLNAFVNAQSVLDSSGEATIEDMLGVGVSYRATEKLDLSAEYFSDGDNDGARVGVGYRHRQNSSSYLNYVTEQGAFAREGITLGQRSEVNDRLNVYSEHRFDRSGQSNVQGNSYGISYDFTERWTLEGDVLFGTTERSGVEQERTAYSATSRYRDEGIQLVNRFEYRVDESNTGQSLDQWVTTNRWNLRYSDDWAVLGRADYAVTEDDNSLRELARFGEFDLGFAYRPVEDNRLNALAMVSYIYDLDPLNQNGGMYADEKGVVYSFEGLYAVTERLKVGGKLAHKRSSIRVNRDSGSFIDATTDLRILRARYHMVWKLDVLAEYRWLEIDEIGDDKKGGLLGVDLQLSPNLAVGVGYNFTEFNDRLTSLNYDAKGWFLNLSGRF